MNFLIYKYNYVLKFGIIGCGKIADKRSNFLNKNEIIICYDKNKSIMKQFSNKYNCHVANNVDEILNNKNINLLLISIYHNSLSNNSSISYIKKN